MRDGEDGSRESEESQPAERHDPDSEGPTEGSTMSDEPTDRDPSVPPQSREEWRSGSSGAGHGGPGSQSPGRRGPDRPLGGRSGSWRTDSGPSPRDGVRPALSWLLTTDHGAVLFIREMVVSVLVVLSIGMLLFAISGVWPPLVAVESGSMEPHLYRGDLVFVMDEQRFAPEIAVEGTGVVTAEMAKERDYSKFGGPGDVIVYKPFGSEVSTPVIHRAHFWVEEDENWYTKVDTRFVKADSCEELRYCPAPYDGFITKGDNEVSNDYYDQARGISTPVKPEWVRGRAVVRIPWLGWVRLAVSDMKLPGVSSAMDAIEGPIHSTAPAY